jgi:hypothetical protein
VRKYKCKPCDHLFFVQFAEDGAQTYHHTMPPKDQTKVARLAGSTHIAAATTLWFPPEDTP